MKKTKRLIKAIILSIAFSIFLTQSAFAQYLPTVINPASIININPQLNQYIRVGTTGYRYDANGNMILEGSQQYVYDEEDRLTSTINGNQVAVYEYNGLDQRISQTINGDYTRFIYDGDRIIEEYDVQNQNTASYIYGPGIDEVLLMVRGGNEYYYIYDGQGSVAQLIDERNTTLETYIYDAYGNPNQPSQHGNPYLFTGRRYDATSNLYHYRARAYHPTLGRFLQRDPIGFTDDINLYRYVGNNPVNYVDPSGLSMLSLIPWENSEIDKVSLEQYLNDLYELENEDECTDKPTLTPEELDTFTQISLGLGPVFGAAGKMGQLADWIRTGDTLVPPGVIGKGAVDAVKTWGIKGGGTNPVTKFRLPFHYHVHKYNWYKPWAWFKYTPMK